MTRPNIREQSRTAANGLVLLPVFILVLLLAIVGIILGASMGPLVVVPLILVLVTTFICLLGFFMVAPNEGKVLQLFGRYVGSVRDPGLRWANPFFAKRRVSLRVRNFDSQKLKVNDADGNPIEIASVVVWRVIDTAEAIFQVEDFEDFVRVQSEAALRNLATHFPYDAHQGEEISLRGSSAAVSEKLRTEIQDRLEQAGVQVLEARISHLAYSPEIASAMLQRQQAGAIIAARQKIVEGAVGMVETALEMLAHKHVVTLDEERKAAMVSNLLVVLCSDRHAQPVVNTGTLHQ